MGEAGGDEDEGWENTRSTNRDGGGQRFRAKIAFFD